LLAFALYLVVTFLFFGGHQISHPRHECLCENTSDPSISMWALRWWPWAIAHGANPFVSHLVFAPGSFDTASAATVPTAGILLAPVTLALGPIFAYNVLALVGPALAGYAAFRLARRLTGATLPSVAAGYLYAFSSSEAAALNAHPHLFLSFLFPLMVELVLARAAGDFRRRGFLAGLALLMILQLGISTELLLDAIVVGGLVLVAALALSAPDARSGIRVLIAEIVAAGLIAALVTSPFLYYAVTGPFPPSGYPDLYGLDLLNMVVPTALTQLGHEQFASVSSHFTPGAQASGYVGIVLLLAYAAFTVATQRRLATRLLLVAFAASLVFALGTHLHVNANSTIPLPYHLVAGLPLFSSVVPSRAAFFAQLALALGLAIWLALPGRRWLRWSAVAVGAVMLFPNPALLRWRSKPKNPSLFTSGLYRREIPKGSNVLVLPFYKKSNAALWQAETGMWFTLANVFLGPMPDWTTKGKDRTLNAATRQLLEERPPVPVDIAHYLRAYRVRHVLLDPTATGPWRTVLRRLHHRPRAIGGMLIYDVGDGGGVPPGP
jgi:hypothetical protein